MRFFHKIAVIRIMMTGLFFSDRQTDKNTVRVPYSKVGIQKLSPKK